MPKLMEWFRNEMEEIGSKDITPPNHEIQAGEVVIGQLTDPELKKMFTLNSALKDGVTQVLREIQHQIIDHERGSESPEDHERRCPACSQAHKNSRTVGRAKFVDVLFWESVRQELDDEGLKKLMRIEMRGGTIGLTKKWEIVAVPPEPRPSLIELLGLR